MRKLIILIFLIIPLMKDGLAQDTVPVPVSDSSGSTVKKDATVFDIYWVTNCIKSGWKISDTALVGDGLELCDTTHPFIMPVTGKLWRGFSSYHAGWDVGSD
jgi:hypothetical protein